MEKDTVLISTLHNGSGTFTLLCKDDGTGQLDIFDKELEVSLDTSKIEVSDNFSAKDFKYGAEDRNGLLKWLITELKEAKK